MLQEGKWGVNVGNKDRTDIVKVKTLLRAAGLPPNALDAAMSDRVRRHPFRTLGDQECAAPPPSELAQPSLRSREGACSQTDQWCDRAMVRSCGIASHPGTVLRWAAGTQRTLALACSWF